MPKWIKIQSSTLTIFNFILLSKINWWKEYNKFNLCSYNESRLLVIIPKFFNLILIIIIENHENKENKQKNKIVPIKVNYLLVYELWKKLITPRESSKMETKC